MKRTEAIMQAVEKERSLSIGQVAKMLGVEGHVAQRLIGKLVASGQLVLIAGLPKQGVFIKEPETRGFGIPIRNQQQQEVMGGYSQSMNAILVLFGDPEHETPWTVKELVEKSGYHHNTVVKALKRLERQGEAFRKTSTRRGRGRPFDWWSDAPFEDMRLSEEAGREAPSSHKPKDSSSDGRVVDW